MLCEEFEERLIGYLDLSLLPQATSDCMNHMSQCLPCCYLLRAVRCTIHASRTSAAPVPSGTLVKRIVDRTLSSQLEKSDRLISARINASFRTRGTTTSRG